MRGARPALVAGATYRGRVTKWLRCYWDEGGIWFYFELDADGQVTRQVEPQEPDLTPLAAASLDEWLHAQKASRLAEYEA